MKTSNLSFYLWKSTDQSDVGIGSSAFNLVPSHWKRTNAAPAVEQHKESSLR